MKILNESRCSTEGVKVEKVLRESVDDLRKLFFVFEVQPGIRFC